MAPVVAHGAWRPLEHVFGAAGSASAVTATTLVVTAITLLAGQFGRGRAWLPPLAGGLAAAGAASALSLGVAGLLTLLLVLQIGNFHAAAVVLAVLAMVAFDQGRSATGGALLALTILAKIAPGILGIVLLVQRRFRSAAFAAGFGVVLLVFSVLLFGTDTTRSFLTYALPRLSSGAAFPFMNTPEGIATNLAPFGVPFKLDLLGLNVGDPWRVGPTVSRVYTLGLVAVTVAGARRRGDQRDQAIRWMSLLVLAALQSPFSAAYATIGLLWATTLLSVEVQRARHAVALVVLWPALLLKPQGLSIEHQALLMLGQMTLTIGVSAWLILRAPRSVTDRPEPTGESR